MYTIRNQPEEQNYTQQKPKPVSKLVFFDDKRKTLMDRIESYPFFQENKNNSNKKQFTKNQPHFSEDDEDFNQNQQQYSNIPRKNQWNDTDDVFQPEIFEAYLNLQQPRQTQETFSQRENLVQPSNSMQSHHHTVIQYYQSKSMK